MKRNIPGLRFVRATDWEEVFAVWKAVEGVDPAWQKLAREKGFDSWEAWRKNSLAPLAPENHAWDIYAIQDVNTTVRDFRIGPYPAWQKQFERKNVHTFADLVRLQPEWVRENNGIKHRLQDFPSPTQFIGAYLEDEDVIVLMEGHHRASAVALAVAQGRRIEASEATIALTSLSGDQRPFFDKLLERGTVKQ